eukprot:COSAG04_NODE_10947_length_741_cov_184.300623_1_plen_156_part_10
MPAQRLPHSPATLPVITCWLLLRRLREGKGPLGALHGVPMTIKEHWDVPGWRSTRGNLRTKDNIATEACFLVERLEAAGAVSCHDIAAASILLKMAAISLLTGHLRQDQRPGGPGQLYLLQPGLRHVQQPVGPDAEPGWELRRLRGRHQQRPHAVV